MTSAEIASMLADGNLALMSLMILRLTERLLPFMLDELRREQPDAVVFDSLCLWGMMAARKLGIPSVGSITHFVFDGSEETRPAIRDFVHLLRQVLPALPALMGTRRKLARRYANVFPRRDIFPARGDVNMVFTSTMLQPKSKLIDHRFRFVGPAINAAARDGDFPFEQIVRQPVVYISLGTVNTLDTDFFGQAFAAFADHPGQVIVSVGPYADIANLGPIPGNFIVRNHVPQLKVLQRADLFITHGGMNSVHESLYYGVPMIVIPHQLEQKLNARIVEKHGAGLMLGGRPPYGRVTTEQLRQAAHGVLRDPAYRKAAESIGESLRAAGGYRRAADEIEALVGMPQSVTVP